MSISTPARSGRCALAGTARGPRHRDRRDAARGKMFGRSTRSSSC
jgi:hypothetical protein